METESSKCVHLLAHTDRSHHRLGSCSDSRKRALTGSALNWVQQQKRIEIIPGDPTVLSDADSKGSTGEYDSFVQFGGTLQISETNSGCAAIGIEFSNEPTIEAIRIEETTHGT